MTAEHKFKEINEAYDILKDDQSAPPMTATVMPRSRTAMRARALRRLSNSTPAASPNLSRRCSASSPDAARRPGAAGAATDLR